MNRLTRISRFAVAASLGGALALPAVSANAQDAPPPPASAAGAPAQTGGDPPARAGRIARISGTVSFHGPGADHWDAATLNFPVTSGDALWTEPQATAALDISASRLTLAPATELDIDALDAQTMTATQPQGEVFYDLRHLVPGDSFTLRTPRGAVGIAAAGRYEIAAGDTQAPTTVTVIEGTVRITADNLALTVQAGQTATITGDTTFTGSVGPAVRDAFLTSMVSAPAATAVTVAQAAPPPPAVAAMPGSEDLAQYGGWQPSPQYGTVWYPQVAAGWVPYRDGHWAYVGAWGWTWVDNEPWGFAPFHYGRWVQVENRWGWAPVYAAPGYAQAGYFRPVYAPALVSFVGFGVGVGIGIGASVGWFPLGWNEPYRPWYHYNPGYMENINRGYVANVTNITTINNFNYAHRNMVTVVPGSVMVNSRPVAASVQRLTPQQFAGLRPAAIPPVRPSATTLGVTPVVARQLNLPAASGSAVGGRAAPGPAFSPTPTAARAGVSAVPLRPAGGIRPAAAAVQPHTNGAPGPQIGPRAAGTATPSLRAPVTPGRTPTVAHGPAAPGPAIGPHTSGVPVMRPPSAAARQPVQATHGAAPTHVTAAPRSQTAPAAHPGAAPQARPAPQAHTAPAPAPRPQAHEAPRPAAPRPQAQEAARPQAAHEAPRPQAHEAPRPAARAEPAKHCEPNKPC